MIFTGSATEANNLALLGPVRTTPPDKRHQIVSWIEHALVITTAEYLETLGWEVT